MKNYFFALLSMASAMLQSQNLLFIPDTLSGTSFSLTMHRDSVQFFPGKKSNTYAFNTNKYLGPTLFFKQGTTVSITVNNQVGDTTTVHWHGVHVPSKWDGGPQTPILPNSTWSPTFKVLDHAATYWYHPHMHMKTAIQAIKGAAGLIIVRDEQEAAFNLPRRYGIDDFPLVVQCQQYDSLNQAMPRGMRDSTILVNGTRNPYVNLPAQVIRLRLLNASGERSFNFGLSGNKSFYQIASDGGLLDNANLSTRLRLSPGERAEILVNLNGLSAQTLSLMCYGSELPMGVQGGPTMPMPPGSPPMNSPLNGIDYSMLKINVVAQSVNPITVIPTSLVANALYPINSAIASRKISFTADSVMVMDGPFYFNDSSFNMMRIDYRIPLNSTEIWTLINRTMVAHPFHLHDAQFFLIQRNGIPVSAEEKGRKDVVLVLPDDSVSFITKFEDYADDQIPYMFHCHILMHEDDGMMGQFIVSSNGVGLTKQRLTYADFLIYPNPSENSLHIKTTNKIIQKAEVYNLLGQSLLIINAMALSEFDLDISELQRGSYIVKLSHNEGTQTFNFIKK